MNVSWGRYGYFSKIYIYIELFINKVVFLLLELYFDAND